MKLRLFKVYEKGQPASVRHTRVVAKRQLVVRLVLLNRQKFRVSKQCPRPLSLHSQPGHHMPVLKDPQLTTVTIKDSLFRQTYPIQPRRLQLFFSPYAEVDERAAMPTKKRLRHVQPYRRRTRLIKNHTRNKLL